MKVYLSGAESDAPPGTNSDLIQPGPASGERALNESGVHVSVGEAAADSVRARSQRNSTLPPLRDSELPPDSGSWGEVGNYAGRDGAHGRGVFFRPDRYQLADLGPVGVAVRVHLLDEVHSCELFDVSQNGAAFAWPVALSPELGSTLSRVVVRFDEHDAYAGEACVSSVRRDAGRVIVGVSFTETLMNIEDVLHLRDVKAWTGSAQRPALGLAAAPWHVPGHDRFKSLVSDLRLLLLDAEATLGELENSLPWHLAHGEADSPARQALVERIRQEVVMDVVGFSDEIDAALRLASPAERHTLREFSMRHLDHAFMQSPSMHRARHKPLGYPGDYDVMNDIYGHHFKGSSLFAKAVNLAFTSTAAARAVRARKDLIKGRLAALVDSSNGARPLRILSIAAGPAQEVYELLRDRDELPGPLEVVLFDQDKRALAYSYGRLKRIVGERWRDKVKLVHLHDSIKRLLRGTTVFGKDRNFDAVYSCGLLDYLQPPTVVSLIRGLFESVAPGGTLYVGNMVPANPSRWFMELHLEWFLNYREREEIFALAQRAAPDAELVLLEEATGYNPFAALTRADC